MELAPKRNDENISTPSFKFTQIIYLLRSLIDESSSALSTKNEQLTDRYVKLLVTSIASIRSNHEHQKVHPTQS